MKKLAFLTLLAFLFVKPAHSTSLDEIYRDLVKSDNEGYLPLYVKNRKIPDVLIEDTVFKIQKIISGERMKRVRQIGLPGFVKELVAEAKEGK